MSSGVRSHTVPAADRVAMSLPRLAQSSAAFRAAAFTGSGSLSHFGNGASVNNRALNGPAFIAPIPFVFR